jgi:uncharacterized OB-fold protein
VGLDQRERPRLDPEHGRLVGSRCSTCGAASWPGRAVCHRCGSTETASAPLPSEGSLLSLTTVRVEPPYAIGEVELEPGVRIYAHIRDADGIATPAPVRVVLSPDPDAAVAFWFVPAERR